MADTQVLIAARQSRVIKGRDQVSIERQDDTARTYATSVGDTEPIVAADAGVSGSVSPFKRPDLGPYLTDNPPRPWTELVAATIDRLGRNARDLAELRNWCEDHGKKITILSPRMSWPPAPDDFSSQIVWTVLEALAEIQLRQIRKTYEDTRNYLRSQKALFGRACWGFQIVGPKAKKTLMPDPSKSGYLLKMIEMAEAGKTLREIAEYLDSESVPPKYNGHWAPRSIGDILRNESLYGVYRDNGKILLRHEGVISKERFDRLQGKLNSNPKRRGPTRNDPRMLTDVIVCGNCGLPMHARDTFGQVKKDGTRSVWHYYRCDGKPRQPSKCRNTIKTELAEEALDHWVTAPDLANAEITEMVYVPAQGFADQIQEVEDEIDSLDKSDPDYLSEVIRLMTERQRLVDLGTIPAHREERKTGIKLADYWPTLEVAGKRDYLMRAGVKVIVTRETRPGQERKSVVVEGQIDRIRGALVI